jgi:hypothetical protein
MEAEMLNPTQNLLIARIEIEHAERILREAEINRVLRDSKSEPQPLARWTLRGLNQIGRWFVAIGSRLESFGAQRAQIA